MSSIAKKIVKNRKVQNLSKYLNEAYTNGHNRGTLETMTAYIAKVKELENIKGISPTAYKKIIKHLQLEDLV